MSCVTKGNEIGSRNSLDGDDDRRILLKLERDGDGLVQTRNDMK
jgi:hypothetical protein